MSGPLNPGTPAAGDGAAELERGPLLLARLHGLMRALRLYDRGNQTVRQQLEDLGTLLSGLPNEENTILSMGDYFYLNGFRLRPSPNLVSMFRALHTEFATRGIAGVRFREGASTAEVESFLARLVRVADAEQAEKLAQELTALGVTSVLPVLTRELGGQTPTPEAAEAEDAGELQERQRAKRVFSAAVRGAERTLAATARTGRPALQQARRVVQPLVDRIMKHEYSIIGLTALKDHDEYTYVHCVNVSILSIRIGQAVGLARADLANLGVAALLHDLGKIAVPIEVLRKPGRLDRSEWAAICRHPLEGFKSLCRLPHVSGTMLEAARVALHHHVSLDGSGYPPLCPGSKPSTLARIVAVADFFDAVTAHRPYRHRPMTGFEALQLIVSGEREKFDPAVRWALVQAVGVYPAGSVLETASGHLVLSISPVGEDVRRPHCRVLRFPDGREPAPEQPMLWQPMPPSERVVRVLPPEEHDGLDEMLLAA